MKIGLVTDSTSDIPPDLVELHAIEVVPAILNIGDLSLEDGIGITRDKFYEQLPFLSTSPTTAAPSVGNFQSRYDQLFSKGIEKILSIHPSNKLSGIYNAARLAAQSFAEKVIVLDSGQISLGLGFQVLAAAESISQGLKLEDILQLLESIKQRVRVVALLDTVEYMRRSGRVSWAKAMVGGLLNLKPMIELRFGLVERAGQTRTREQGIKHLIENLQSWGSLERLAVLHTNSEEAARNLLESLSIKLQDIPLVVNVTTVIGTHVGPNGLGFAAVPRV